MKKVFLGIFLAAVFSFAGTCTEILFSRMGPLGRPVNGAYLDSVYNESYYGSGHCETSKKYYYKDSLLDSLLSIEVWNEEYDWPDSSFIYVSHDGTERRGVGTGFIFAVEKIGDTTVTKMEYYRGDTLSLTEMFFEYDKGTQKVIKDSSYDHRYRQYEVKESVFYDNEISQTVTFVAFDDDGTYLLNETEHILYKQDGVDDLKCSADFLDIDYKYEETFQIINKDNGFMFRETGPRFVVENFYVNQKAGTTASPVRRAPVKVSPKARYFDLLGRYKFTR